MVVDRAAGLGGELAEADDGIGADGAGVPVDGVRGERLGLTRPHDRRRHRTEGDAHRAGRPVDGETDAGDGDDHRVAHADLGVALPAVEQRDGHRGDQLARRQRGALDPDHELGDRHRPPAGGTDQLDLGVERGQHGQPVTGRRAGRQVAADGRRVADLRRPDGARRLGEGGEHRRQRVTAELGVRHAGAEAHRPGDGVVGPRAQLGDAPDGDDGLPPGQPTVRLVDRDHQVGAAGQHDGVRVLGERGDSFVQRHRCQHAHVGRLYKASRDDESGFFAIAQILATPMTNQRAPRG